MFNRKPQQQVQVQQDQDNKALKEKAIKDVEKFLLEIGFTP